MHIMGTKICISTVSLATLAALPGLCFAQQTSPAAVTRVQITFNVGPLGLIGVLVVLFASWFAAFRLGRRCGQTPVAPAKTTLPGVVVMSRSGLPLQRLEELRAKGDARAFYQLLKAALIERLEKQHDVLLGDKTEFRELLAALRPTGVDESRLESLAEFLDETYCVLTAGDSPDAQTMAKALVRVEKILGP